MERKSNGSLIGINMGGYLSDHGKDMAAAISVGLIEHLCRSHTNLTMAFVIGGKITKQTAEHLCRSHANNLTLAFVIGGKITKQITSS
jgi:hypothetical protein